MTERRDRIQVHIDGKEYSVVGGSFQDMLGAVKQISGRRFIGEQKAWQIPGSREDVQAQLEVNGYRLEGGNPLGDKMIGPKAAQPGPSGDRIRVLIEGHQLAVVGGNFQEMLSVVKNLPGRRFDAEKKVWEIAGELGLIQGLVQAGGFQLEGADSIAAAPIPPAEPPDFASRDQVTPPAYEAPEFLDEESVPPYEPPDWWDDAAMPPPPEPPESWEEDAAALSDDLGLVSGDLPAANHLLAAPPAVPSSAVPSRGSPGSARRDQIRIRVGGIPMLVTGGPFREMLEVVKRLPDRRFDGDDKVWDVPGEIGLEGVRRIVTDAGFELERG
jgi:hypothetical protein